MLVELSVMEQRYQAVLAVVQGGWKVVEVAERLGVSRQTIHNWIARTSRAGLPCWRIVHGGRTDVHIKRADVEAQICDCVVSTRAGARGGSSTAAPISGRSDPSRSSIHGCLKRHGLISCAVAARTVLASPPQSPPADG